MSGPKYLRFFGSFRSLHAVEVSEVNFDSRFLGMWDFGCVLRQSWRFLGSLVEN